MPLEAAPPPLTGHNLVYNGDFARGARSLPWNGELSKPAAGRTFVDKGELCMEVKNRGPNRWDAQLRHQHIKLEKGHTYTVQFKMRSSQPTRAYLKLGQAGPPFKEFWKLLFPISDKQQAYSGTFTMQAPDDPSVELAFHFGGQLSRLTPVPFTVCLDDVRVDDPQVRREAGAGAAAGARRPGQPGRLPAGAGQDGDGQDAPDAVGWQLVKTRGEVVASGKTIPFGADAASGDQVPIADFSSSTAKGKGYTLKVGNDVSHPFDIARRHLQEAQVRRARVLLPPAQRHRDRDAVRGRASSGRARRATSATSAQHGDKACRARQDSGCDYTLDVTRRLVRRRRPRQIRGQRRHLGVDAAEPVRARAGARRRAGDFGDGKLNIPEKQEQGPRHPRRGALGAGVHAQDAGARGQADGRAWCTTRSTTRSGRRCGMRPRRGPACSASCGRRARRRR